MIHGIRFTAFLAAVALVGALLVACDHDGEPPVTPTPTTTATASSTNTPRTTPTPSVEELVATAYLAYWDAYAKALLNLDASLVEAVARGEELDRIREEVEMLRADGFAARVVVEHDFAVVSVSGGRAVVVDQFLDRSFYVDPATKKPETSSVPGRTVRDTFQLEQRPNGTWVVVSSVRER